jgi:hypothetical protein
MILVTYTGDTRDAFLQLGQEYRSGLIVSIVMCLKD